MEISKCRVTLVKKLGACVGSIDRMWRKSPESNDCRVDGGYGSPLTFLVSAIYAANHLFSCVESISSSSVSGYLSALHFALVPVNKP